MMTEEEVPADPLAEMMARLRESGAIEIARLQALEIADRARAALVNVPDTPVRLALYELVDMVVNRDK